MADTNLPVPESPGDFAGAPDAFQRLWTPHRWVYIGGENKPTSSDAGQDCPFCRAPTKPDEESLIVARGAHCYAVLNLYPYNPGHLLICPYRHIPLFTDLEPAERDEFAAMSAEAMRALTEASHPGGFNLGINQGAIGGAGVAAHLHQHVVPRWEGDSNFLPVIAQTKALPQLLGQVREQLAAHWPAGQTPAA